MVCFRAKRLEFGFTQSISIPHWQIDIGKLICSLASLLRELSRKFFWPVTSTPFHRDREQYQKTDDMIPFSADWISWKSNRNLREDQLTALISKRSKRLDSLI